MEYIIYIISATGVSILLLVGSKLSLLRSSDSGKRKEKLNFYAGFPHKYSKANKTKMKNEVKTDSELIPPCLFSAVFQMIFTCDSFTY